MHLSIYLLHSPSTHLAKVSLRLSAAYTYPSTHTYIFVATGSRCGADAGRQYLRQGAGRPIRSAVKDPFGVRNGMHIWSLE